MKNFQYFFFVLLLFACYNDEDLDFVAKVHDQSLSREELLNTIPQSASAEDSIKLANLFIDNWIRKQVVLQQAELNLSDYQKDVSKELQSYKEDLIIYRYERELLRQKLDTTISSEKIEEFYLENIEMFKLKDYALQVIYASFPVGHEHAKDVLKLVDGYQSKDSLELASFCEDPDFTCFLDNHEWIYLKNLLKEIPLTFYNEESFLKKDKFVEFEKNGETYLISIENYKLKDAYSPIDLESANIKSLILNSRKVKLLENMRNELFENALNNGKIELEK